MRKLKQAGIALAEAAGRYIGAIAYIDDVLYDIYKYSQEDYDKADKEADISKINLISAIENFNEVSSNG